MLEGRFDCSKTGSSFMNLPANFGEWRGTILMGNIGCLMNMHIGVDPSIGSSQPQSGTALWWSDNLIGPSKI